MSVKYYRSAQLEIIHQKNRQIIYDEHNHASVHIACLVLQGEVVLRQEGLAARFGTGEFFAIRPYRMHTLILPKHYELLSLCVHERLILNAEPEELYRMLAESLRQIPIPVDDVFLKDAVDALYPLDGFLPHDDGMLAGARHLRQNPEIDVRLQEIADKAYLSKFHFLKRFKREIGMPPHRFHLQNRIRRAQRLLEDGESSAAIASALRFYDQSHFIRCFKKIVGLTPAEYGRSFQKMESSPNTARE